MAWTLTRPGHLVGAVNFSGFLVDSPLVALENVDPATIPPVFWGHGLQDASIPFELGERGRERLRRSGIGVESFDHPGGHTITAEELHAFRRWLQTLEGKES
jgi:predicted esterase